MDEALAAARSGIRPQVAEALGAFGVGGRAQEHASSRGLAEDEGLYPRRRAFPDGIRDQSYSNRVRRVTGDSPSLLPSQDESRPSARNG
jgi:hypothetical protein